MDTFLTILFIGLLCVGGIVLLATLGAMALLGAGRRYHKKLVAKDAKALQKYLPGKNCGTCGQKTCQAFAQEAAWDAALLKGCPYLTSQDLEEMEALIARRDAMLRTRQEADKQSEKLRDWE